MIPVVDLALQVPAEMAQELLDSGIAEVFQRQAKGKCKKIAKCVVKELSSDQADKVRTGIEQMANVLTAPGQVTASIDNLASTVSPAMVHNKLRTALPSSSVVSDIVEQGESAFPMAQQAVGTWMNTALSAATLAAVVVSTAIIVDKLNGVDKKLDQLLDSVDSAKRVILETGTCKVCRSLVRDYKELKGKADSGETLNADQVIETIKGCHDCIENLMKLQSEYPMDSILNIIYSLIPTFADLIILYYRNFYDAAKPRYPLHEDWMGLYDSLCTEQYLEDMRDYLMIQLHWHNDQVMETLDLQKVAALGLKGKIETALKDLDACGSREKCQRTYILASQYAMMHADLLQTEIANECGDDEAAYVMNKARQQVMYA